MYFLIYLSLYNSLLYVWGWLALVSSHCHLWRVEQGDDAAWHWKAKRCSICSDAAIVPFCCQKAKLSIYLSIFIATLTYGYKLTTKRTRVRKHRLKWVSSLRRHTVGALSRATAGRGGSGISFDCLLVASQERCSGHGRGTQKNSGHTKGTASLWWPRNALGACKVSWRR